MTRNARQSRLAAWRDVVHIVLDAVLEGVVDNGVPPDRLPPLGASETTVRKIADMVANSEHKRRQAPPGPKVSPTAFGRDRRVPITVARRFWNP